jgi:trimeric autotransporter adhesin
MGYLAGRTNTIGSGNTALGTRALMCNAASNNTAVGLCALHCNTTGVYNTAVGAFAARFAGTGTRNVAMGVDALHCNTARDLTTQL